MRHVFLMVLLLHLPTQSEPQAAVASPYRRVIELQSKGLSPKTRITGGHDTTLAEHPWQVALVATGVQSNASAEFCGGSVIGIHWVLTAAHCLDGVPDEAAIKILVGTDSLNQPGRRLKVDCIKRYDKWLSTGHDFDIALIHSPDQLTGQVDLWRGSDTELDNQTFVVSGWGALAWEPDPPRMIQLQAVEVKFVPPSLCKSPASYGSRLTDNMFCAGDYLNGGVDACTYDSGGPATISRQSHTYLVGVVSWGDGCGEAKKPGVYTKVLNFVNWIKTETHQEVS
jgi:secreted trypsin-like serine protease